MVLPGPSCLCIGYGAPQEGELIDEATDLPVCDYDEAPTELYKALEEHQWGAVSRFLKTGVWPGSFFSAKRTPKQQVKTWIHRYSDTRHEIRDDDGHDMANMASLLVAKATNDSSSTPANVNLPPPTHNGRALRWRQLPLHAALIFMAPPSIVKQIIELFPYALRCPDDKGMLPLHLAFRQAVPDDILTILLRMFPNGMHVRDQRGRLPVECVRVDLVNTGGGGAPPLRGMIIQSIMQQSKDKFSKQQQDTIQSFQKDIAQLHTKMQSLEQHLQVMDQREQTTRQELSSTLDQLNSLKKNHRKLQEMQAFSLQRQSEQESKDKQHQDFQQQLLEKLDLGGRPNMGIGRSRSRGRSHSRGRRREVDHLRDDPPSPQQPDMHLRPSDSRGYLAVRRGLTQQSPSQSSFTNEEDSPSYSSDGVSRFTDFTKSVPNHTYTRDTAFTTARSSGRPSRGLGRAVSPAIYRTQSQATKATHGTHTTFHTQAQLAATADEEESHTGDMMNDVSLMPLHGYQSILDRRRRSTKNGAASKAATPLYPIKVQSNSTEKALDGTTNSNTNMNGKAPTATPNACGVGMESPGASLNWDFSFTTPGFMRPLSVNEL